MQIPLRTFAAAFPVPSEPTAASPFRISGEALSISNMVGQLSPGPRALDQLCPDKTVENSFGQVLDKPQGFAPAIPISDGERELAHGDPVMRGHVAAENLHLSVRRT